MDFVKIDSIKLGDRVREDYGEIEELSNLLLLYGQLYPVLIEHDNTLVDGGRRIRALQLLAVGCFTDPALEPKMAAVGLRPGYVKAEYRENLSTVQRRLLEYATNTGKPFEWQETARLIKEVHEEYMETTPNWDAEKTAALLSKSKQTIWRYLNLTDNEAVFVAPQVQQATTLNTAIKQASIVKEIQKRQIIVAYQEQKAIEQPLVVQFDYLNLAKKMAVEADCQDWIKKIPDESLSWFHWDPVYGTREGGGGAFNLHEGLSMDPVESFNLMFKMMPEIWRTMRPGAWMIFWYSPVYYHKVLNMLRGHEAESNYCIHCGEDLLEPEPAEGQKFCIGNPEWAFWTNPFPNLWRKTGVGNDGHEITRFLKKDYEPFLLCAKGSDPILPRTNRGNIFDHDVPLFGARRHVAHKPAGLLQEILDVVSIGGEVGADPGAGSGSIIEAAFNSGRYVVCCDIERNNAATCQVIAERVLKERLIQKLWFAEWL